MFKKITALSLAAVMAFAALTGCGASTKKGSETDPFVSTSDSNMVGNVYKTGMPIVKDKVTLKYATIKSAGHTRPYAEMDFIKDLEKQTNVHIEWDEIPGSGWTEKINLMFASNELPDAIMGMMPDTTLLLYASQGMILPMESYLDKWSTNLKAIFAKRPDLKKVATAPDGHIYSTFSLDESPWVFVRDQLFIDQVWLDKVGKKMPATTDEFYDVLKAFKERDPNGNGKQDEIPFSFSNGSDDNAIYSMFGAFGIADNGSHLAMKDGKVMYTAIQPGYKEGLKWFNKLIKEGLMDKEGFIQDASQLDAKTKSKDNIIGSRMAFLMSEELPSHGGELGKNWELVLPLKGPKGDQLWPKVGVPGIRKNTFTITNACKNPEIAFRWIDNILDDGENSVSMRNGPKDVVWKKVDGKVEFIEPPQDMKITRDQWSNMLSPGGGNPISLLTKTSRDADSLVLSKVAIIKMGAVKEYEPFTTDKLPQFYLNVDNIEKVAKITTNLDSYVKNNIAKFMLDGFTDKEWDDFVAQVKKTGADELVKIYQERLDSYNK